MKRFFALFFGISLMFGVSHAQTLEDYMFHMVPSSTQLTSDLLKRLIASYKETGSASHVVNLYRDTSSLLQYEENNYAFFQLSDQGYVSSKMWQFNDSTQVYGFSSWVCGTMCDGWWRIQTAGGKSVSFPKVEISDFFDKEKLEADGLTSDSLANRFEMIFLHCEFSRGDSVHIYCDTERYLEKERKDEYSKYFKGNRVSLLPIDGEFKIVCVKRDDRFNEIH